MHNKFINFILLLALGSTVLITKPSQTANKPKATKEEQVLAESLLALLRLTTRTLHDPADHNRLLKTINLFSLVCPTDYTYNHLHAWQNDKAQFSRDMAAWLGLYKDYSEKQHGTQEIHQFHALLKYCVKTAVKNKSPNLLRFSLELLKKFYATHPSYQRSGTLLKLSNSI